METTLNIKLKASVARFLDQKTKELKTNADAVINKALEDYFYFERLKSLRQKTKGQAEKLGFIDEEDIFEAIS